MFCKKEWEELRSYLVLYDHGKQKIHNSEHLNRYYSKGIYKKDQIFKFTI